jgi:arsenate reductase
MQNKMAKKKNVRLSSSASSAEHIEVWHKPTCSKSCEVMSLLKKEKVKPDVFLYLETPPGEEEIKSVLKKLGIKAEELIRKKESIYKEKFEGKKMTEEKWIKAMVKYPILIERPIVIKGNKAVIGRPTEKILEIIK